ncbi:MAG TPA: terminase large subunit, partial [Longimicrobium sp.]|nr:terminase large subunit [Longimicrobium sp.]
MVARRIVAGPHVRDACARHIRDLKHGPKRGLTWDVELAREAIAFFAEILCLAEDVPFILHDWQQFIVGSLFGWLGQDGYRRFRVAYVETGKGSGKSPLAAGIGLKMLVADGEYRAECYAAAAKKDQAMVLFRDAVAIVKASPELRARLGFSGGDGREWNIAYLDTASFFRPISSESQGRGQ